MLNKTPVGLLINAVATGDRDIIRAEQQNVQISTLPGTALYQAQHFARHSTLPGTALYQVQHFTRYSILPGTALYQVQRFTRHSTLPGTLEKVQLVLTQFYSKLFPKLCN